MTEQFFAYAVWGAIILGGGSLVAIIAFWMRLGSDISKGREAKATVKELELRFDNFRVAVAQNYATTHDLAEAEGRTASAVESMRAEIRTLNDRLLQIIK